MADQNQSTERLAAAAERLASDAEIKWLEQRVQAGEYLLKCQERGE